MQFKQSVYKIFKATLESINDCYSLKKGVFEFGNFAADVLIFFAPNNIVFSFLACNLSSEIFG